MPNILVGSTQSAAPVQAAVGTSSIEIVAATEQRSGLTIVNISGGTVYLGFGTNAAILRGGIAITADGGSWSMDEYTFTKEAINAIGHSATLLVGVQEFLTRS